MRIYQFQVSFPRDLTPAEADAIVAAMTAAARRLAAAPPAAAPLPVAVAGAASALAGMAVERRLAAGDTVTIPSLDPPAALRGLTYYPDADDGAADPAPPVSPAHIALIALLVAAIAVASGWLKMVWGGWR